MKINNILSEDRDVVSLTPDHTVLEATKRMVETHCGSVVLIREDGRLAGIFTERDLMVRIVSKGLDPKTTKLGKVMTSELYTTTRDRMIAEVRREMRQKHIRHVPVMESGKVRAVLSMRDLMRAAREARSISSTRSSAVRSIETAPA